MPYTEAFKAQMVRRMIGPPGITATALAKEAGVSQSQLSRWLKGAAVQGDMSKKTEPIIAPKSLRAWTAREKLRLIAAAEGAEGSALAELLRREGAHSEQLEQWRRSAEGALSDEKRPPSAEVKASAKRIKELERELWRKEKALAESAALLFLEKKLQAMGWGQRHEAVERDESNER